MSLSPCVGTKRDRGEDNDTGAPSAKRVAIGDVEPTAQAALNAVQLRIAESGYRFKAGKPVKFKTRGTEGHYVISPQAIRLDGCTVTADPLLGPYGSAGGLIFKKAVTPHAFTKSVKDGAHYFSVSSTPNPASTVANPETAAVLLRGKLELHTCFIHTLHGLVQSRMTGPSPPPVWLEAIAKCAEKFPSLYGVAYNPMDTDHVKALTCDLFDAIAVPSALRLDVFHLLRQIEAADRIANGTALPGDGALVTATGEKDNIFVKFPIFQTRKPRQGELGYPCSEAMIQQFKLEDATYYFPFVYEDRNAQTRIAAMPPLDRVLSAEARDALTPQQWQELLPFRAGAVVNIMATVSPYVMGTQPGLRFACEGVQYVGDVPEGLASRRSKFSPVAADAQVPLRIDDGHQERISAISAQMGFHYIPAAPLALTMGESEAGSAE